MISEKKLNIKVTVNIPSQEAMNSFLKKLIELHRKKQLNIENNRR